MYQSLKNSYVNAVLLLSLFFILPAYSQQLNFENYTTEQGLSDKQVLSISQDQNGYIFIGTYKGGITKFNGLIFEKITDKDGAPSNLIYSLTQLDEQNLIIGTDKGLSIWNGKKFKNYSKESGLPDESVYNILVDSKKTAWIATGKGVTTFNNNKFLPFNINPTLNNSIVFNIYEDSKNNKWFCTAYNGLFKYDGTTITRYYSKNNLDCDAVYSIIELGNDNYWILTDKNIFELKNNILSKIDVPFFQNWQFYFCALKDKRNGDIWIGTDQGLLKYHDKKFALYNTKNGLVNNVIWKIFQDRENNLWFASKDNDGGVSKLSSERFLSIGKAQGLLKNEIKGIVSTAGNGQLLLTQSAISELENYKVKMNILIPQKLSTGDLTSFSMDKTNTLWLASEYGVKKLNNYKFDSISTTVLNKNLLSCNYILAAKNNTWLGTLGGLAIIEKNKIVPYTRFKLETPVNTLHEDKKGQLWIGTNHGIYLLKETMLDHFSEKDGAPEKIIQAFCEDDQGNIYIASEVGLFIYKNNSKKFIKISDKNGLSSNDIASVGIDNKGYVWAGTNNGLNRIEIENDSVAGVKYYSTADGFTGESCSYSKMLVDSNGHLLIPTNNGLMIYQPEYDLENTKEPLTHITSVKINGDESDWLHHIDSAKTDQQFMLPYTKNNFIFSFIGVSLTAPQKVKYQYMLLGFDKKLNSTTQLHAAYNNLGPGSYEFLVKACNNDGVWNKEAVSFKFEIMPPFYRTYWFYTLCILIIMGGIFSYIKIKHSNIQILKQQKIIQLKNSELEKANDEIAQYNKNITDSITYAKRIQDAILPAHKRIRKHLKDFFILYKPKDIVSGDFYWFDHFNNKSMIAAVDCTGHGVPGALVSMVGHNGLTRVINEFALTQPAAILDKLNELVEETLRQNDKTAVKDGMDMAIVTIDESSKKIHFAGANNGLYLLRKKQFKVIDNFIDLAPVLSGANYNLFEIKPDKQPIGSESEKSKNFTNHTIDIENGDLVYLFTDGYADQFGGPRGKKFLYKPFKELLLAVCEQPMTDQKKAIADAFKSWKGSLEQVDDVCIIGIRLT
jgi:ligand-binding sensor domain-containing protein/serine phosphatase RsbU (regulator of sigma subunit)